MDYRKSRTPVTPLSVHGEEVEIVADYKYLGVHIDNKLDWTLNGSVLGMELDPIHVVAERRMLSNFTQSWTIPLTHYIMCWSTRGAHSVRE